MDTYTGRRSTSGAWVAVGPATEIEGHAAHGDVVEVTTPSRAVARVRIIRAGQPFVAHGERWAYGYIEDTTVGVA